MTRNCLVWFTPLLAVTSVASACSSQGIATTERGGGAFGDDVIGYQNSEKARDDASSGSLSSGGGLATDAGAGGSLSTGGTTAAYGGEGGALRNAKAIEPPSDAVTDFTEVVGETLSTFALDADSGSYTLSRAAINAATLPLPTSVRVEEFLNYFDFHYAPPGATEPVSVYTELAQSPWNSERELLLLGMQGVRFELGESPPLNLVYLVDVSGSMQGATKLGLIKSGLRMLTRQLRPTDRLSLVTYAGAERTVLDGASGAEQETIQAAIDELEAAGSTNGEGGILRAYELAKEHFIEGGNNRVLLATDGDFNVGISSTGELVDFIAEYRATDIFLSVYGFGDNYSGGNYEDETLEQLADAGNGLYFFIDSEAEAKRAFEHTASGSILTVAKDVKIQVSFNEEQVESFRLIGYENRLLAAGDFESSGADGGELGAGLCVTALYEIVRKGSKEQVPLAGRAVSDVGAGSYPALTKDDLAQVRVRYVDIDSGATETMVRTVGADASGDAPTRKFYFAAGMSALAESLRGTAPEGVTKDEILEFLRAARPLDREGAVEEAIVLAGSALSRIE